MRNPSSHGERYASVTPAVTPRILSMLGHFRCQEASSVTRNGFAGESPSPRARVTRAHVHHETRSHRYTAPSLSLYLWNMIKIKGCNGEP